MHDLGFPKAYGIDLNPGPGNPFVRQGDFMHLTAEPASIDGLYTNCIDYVFDLDLFLKEHLRVLTRDGYAFYDLPHYSSSHAPGAFESIGWKDTQVILDIIRRY